LGLLLHAIVHPADIQDRDGGILVMANLFGMFPFLKKLFADGGYQGPEFNQALARFAAPRRRVQTHTPEQFAFETSRRRQAFYSWCCQYVA
jgi:hypothetical protein